MKSPRSTAMWHAAAWTFLLALCSAAAWAAEAPAASAPSSPSVAPPPLAAFFGAPEIGTVTLSPDGRTLALTVPGKNQRMELVAADLTLTPLRFKTIAWLTDFDVASVHWLNDKRLVFQALDSQAGEWAGITGLWATDADGENGRMLIDPVWAGFRAVVPGNRNILAAEWVLHSVPADGSDDVLVAQRGWSSFGGVASVGLARLNTHVPMPVSLSRGAPDGSQHWLTDTRGQPQVVQALADGKRRIYRRAADASWRELAAFDALELGGWEPRFVIDGQLFVSAERAGATGAQLALWEDDTGGVSAKSVLAAPGFDVGDSAQPILDAPSGQPLGWRYQLDTVYTRWVDPGMAALQAAIDRALPGRVNLIQCQACLKSPRLLVQSLADRQPPAWSVLERSSGRLTYIGSAHPDVPTHATGARSFQRIKARDGRDLPVYVTRPPQAAATPQPAVVYVHGGPWSRVSLEWQHDAVPQFLASRGYVVVEPDFRGSTGYGGGHERAGWGQWGLSMQDDLADALQWAVAQGWVDRQRVCIMGASYGGYAALMGPVRHPEAYRCAISWVAPTDLPALMDDFRSLVGGNAMALRDLSRRMGSGEGLRANSPVHLAAQIRVPVLAAWGVDDRRVRIAQGRDFRDAARKADVALEYVEYPGEGHVWMDPATRLDFFGRVEKLLARSLVAAPR